MEKKWRSYKHQSSASLAFVQGIHRWLHKGQVKRKCFHLMTSSCNDVIRSLMVARNHWLSNFSVSNMSPNNLALTGAMSRTAPITALWWLLFLLLSLLRPLLTCLNSLQWRHNGCDGASNHQYLLLVPKSSHVVPSFKGTRLYITWTTTILSYNQIVQNNRAHILWNVLYI